MGAYMEGSICELAAESRHTNRLPAYQVMDVLVVTHLPHASLAMRLALFFNAHAG